MLIDRVLTVHGLLDERVKLVDDPSGSAGSDMLITGTMEAGYFGTVPSSEFIDGDTLASQVGLTAGTSFNANTDWLKFAYEGKILFSPMRPIRYNLHWSRLNNIGVVFGTTTIKLNNLTYKVRLWRGAKNNPMSAINDDLDTIGSEWNNLMLPLHVNAPDKWSLPNFAGVSENWGTEFTDADFFVGSGYNGRSTICQESFESNTNEHVVRGYRAIEESTTHYKATTSSNNGWRPVLELVQ
jgi:hypothetical protein